MAYQSTTAAGSGDVLDKIRLFAIARGWTINRWRDSPETHLEKELCLSHADAGHFNLIHSKSLYASGQPNSKNDITLQASSSFDANKKTYEQPDASAPSRCALWDYDATKTRNVYIFGTTQYIYVAQELKDNFYTHLCFGKINKAWNYTGGEFVTASWWNFQQPSTRTRSITDSKLISIFAGDAYSDKGSQNAPIWGTSLRCDFADKPGVNWHNTQLDKGVGTGRTYPRSNDGVLEPGYPAHKSFLWRTPYGDLIRCLPQNMNALDPLLPLVPGVRRSSTMYIAGQWPDVRYVNLTHIEPKQEITLGSDTWMCFPLIARHVNNAPTGAYDYTSGVYGIAFKK